MNIFCFCGTLQSVSYRTRFKDWMCEDCFQRRLKEIKKPGKTDK